MTAGGDVPAAAADNGAAPRRRLAGGVAVLLLAAAVGAVLLDRRDDDPRPPSPTTGRATIPTPALAPASKPVGDAVPVARTPFDPRRDAPDEPPTFTGRLLFERAPLAKKEVAVRLRFARDAEPPRDALVTTDADGRFRLAYAPGRTPLAGLDVFEFRLADPSGAVAADATHPAPATPQPGENVLGDVVLAESFPLVAGRVVDDADAPIAGAYVALQPRIAPGAAAEAPSSWKLRALAEIGATTDATGAFVLRGPAPEFDCVVTAVRATYLAEAPPPLVLGGSDVVLRLRRATALSAEFSFEGKPPPFPVELRVVPPVGEPKSARTSAGVAKTRIPAVLCGRLRVEVRIPALHGSLGRTVGFGDAPVAAFDVDLVHGRAEPPAGLAPFALDGVVVRARVAVVDENGAPIPSAKAAPHDASAPGAPAIGRILGKAAGPFEPQPGGDDLFVPPSGVTLDVTAEGRLGRRVKDVRGDVTVMLPPGRPARFTFATPPPPAPETWEWRLQISGGGGDAPAWDAWVEPGVIVRLGGGGPIVVQPWLKGVGPNRASQSQVGGPTKLDAGDPATTETFEAKLPAPPPPDPVQTAPARRGGGRG